MNKREMLVDMGLEDAIVLDGFDDAIIGTSHDDRVIYSYSKMIDCLMHADDMDYEMAAEFIDYNTVRTAQYLSNGPIIMYDLGE